MNISIALAKHGQPKNGKWDFWVTLLTSLIIFALYYWAGLFDKFGFLTQ